MKPVSEHPFLLGSAAVLLGVVILAVISNRELKPEQAAFWDIVIKGGSVAIAVVGAVVTVRKYFDERAKANEAATLEARKPFSAKRQEVYFQLISTTSTIANRKRDDPARAEARDQFWWLFWGPLPLVADEEVGTAVNEFHILLYDSDTAGKDADYHNLSMNVAVACRNSLGFVEPWVVKRRATPSGTPA